MINLQPAPSTSLRVLRIPGCRELLGKHQVITAYTLNNPNVMRLEPPLVVTKAQIDYVLNALEDIFAQKKGLLGMALSVVSKRS